MSLPPFRPPVATPLHPFGWPRPADSTEYRVTQTFDQINPQISMQPHHALDMGNGHLGGPVLAPLAGTVIAEGWLAAPWSQASPASKLATWGPTYGGIMAVLDHHNGYISALAHMQRTIVSKGQIVKVGQQVGNLGATGAAHDQGGHCHWDLYYKGVKVDPWPLLEQNYAAPPDTSIALPKEDTMRYSGATFHVAPNVPVYRLTANSHFRAGPARNQASLQVIPAGTPVPVAYFVDGELIGSNAEWALCFLYVNGAYTSGFLHSSLLEHVDEPAAPTGPTADEVAALVKQGRRAGALDTAKVASDYAAKQ